MRRVLLAVILVTVPLGACSRRQPPAPPDSPPPAGQPPGQPPVSQPPAADPDADARRAAAEATARARAILEEIVHFDYDESTIRADAQATLARKVPLLRANPNVRIRVVGHTDERGSIEYNLALGMRRANAVRDYLAGFGIDAGRFDVHSMGEDMPMDPRSNEQAWALNRRAEFSILAGGETLILPGF